MPAKKLRYRRIHKKFRKEKKWQILTIPNVVTFVRIGIIPFLVAAFYINTKLALGVFMFACATDYVDGYVAKRFKQSSRFGALIDPVADKLLISSALLMMSGLGKVREIHLIPAAIIVWREFLVSGLREFLAASGRDLPVSTLAKYKTALQMGAITCVLADFYIYGIILLWASAAISMISAVQYFHGVWYRELNFLSNYRR
jgi:CDP-diacylglycerol--glycerol-3-phosphate 3-phosphatidyltransferase